MYLFGCRLLCAVDEATDECIGEGASAMIQTRVLFRWAGATGGGVSRSADASSVSLTGFQPARPARQTGVSRSMIWASSRSIILAVETGPSRCPRSIRYQSSFGWGSLCTVLSLAFDFDR